MFYKACCMQYKMPFCSYILPPKFKEFDYRHDEMGVSTLGTEMDYVANTGFLAWSPKCSQGSTDKVFVIFAVYRASSEDLRGFCV